MMIYEQRRLLLMLKRKISLVLDVGANTGQFGTQLRERLGYRGRIVSFEPVSTAFAVLQRTAAGDSLWSCNNYALGHVDGAATINISRNSVSSSLLQATERSLSIEPSIAYIGTQTVNVRRLDGLLNEIAVPGDAIYIKIDTQGYERQVLEGAAGVIGRFELIQLETSFFQAYRGEPLIGEMILYLDSLGYRVVGFESGWGDETAGELLQADLIFARK